MGKTINLNDLNDELHALKDKKQSIVLVGGCFDILHIGHIRFLKEAKRHGDILFILLEHDGKVTNLKGRNRPFFNQSERAEMLSALTSTDLVLLLPYMKSDTEYFNLVNQIKPEIIAVTENDPLSEKKKNQSRETGSKLIIIPFVKTYSSSKLAKIIGIE